MPAGTLQIFCGNNFAAPVVMTQPELTLEATTT
jgi:hypothetical protein